MTSNTEQKTKTIILAAGGTGGHVFPAIATAEELQKRGYNTLFLTDKRGERYFKNTDFRYKVIRSASPSGSLPNRIKSMAILIGGMLQSSFILGMVNPKLVMGFGGYPSFPPLLTARVNFIKTILHEQNSVLGKANRFLAKYSTVLATSFPQTKNASGKARLVGNPVRDAIKEKAYPPVKGRLNILITGGSQGAKLFSEVLPQVLAKYADRLEIIHQVPDNEIDRVKEIYNAAGAEFLVSNFFSNMQERLGHAHLVIGRAGASTIFELATVGRPAILVPLATSAENHQLQNAKAICETGGGWLLEEKDFNEESISVIIGELLENPEKLAEAAENIKKLADNNAAKKLADIVDELVK